MNFVLLLNAKDESERTQGLLDLTSEVNRSARSHVASLARTTGLLASLAFPAGAPFSKLAAGVTDQLLRSLTAKDTHWRSPQPSPPSDSQQQIDALAAETAGLRSDITALQATIRRGDDEKLVRVQAEAIRTLRKQKSALACANEMLMMAANDKESTTASVTQQLERQKSALVHLINTKNDKIHSQASEVLELQKERNDLRSDNENLQEDASAEIEALKTAAVSADEWTADAQEHLAVSVDAVDSAESAIEELAGANENLQGELNCATDEVGSLQSAMKEQRDELCETFALLSELAQAKADMAQLKSNAIAAAQYQLAQLATAALEIARLKDEVESSPPFSSLSPASSCGSFDIVDDMYD